MIDADAVEAYKNKFGDEPALNSFFERSISHPDKTLFRDIKDGLAHVHRSKAVIYIDGM